MLKIVLREGFIHLKVCVILIKDNSKTDVILIDKKEHQMSINALIHALSIEGPCHGNLPPQNILEFTAII